MSKPPRDKLVILNTSDDGQRAIAARFRQGQAPEAVVLEKGTGNDTQTDADEILKMDKCPDDGCLAYDAETVWSRREGSHSGPAQVATRSYRTGWDQTFGKRAADLPN